MREPAFWWRAPAAVAGLLAPLAALYGAVAARRLSQRGRSVGRPVICIGNPTVGGAGKTPTALAVGRMLAAAGERPVFLTRGYGGALAGPVEVDLAAHRACDVGDEPLLLAHAGRTIVARDRVAGARMAPPNSVIVMDDGFQNFQLAKDVSFVVVDAETGFGNGRLIPAGPLREPVGQGLARADAVVLLGAGALRLPSFGGPIMRAELHPTAPDRFAGRSVFAMAGIGRPDKFFHTLQAMGASVVGTRAFPDHHRYTLFEIEAVKQIAANAGALLVTTEKDYVRIDPNLRDGILCVPVHAVFADDPNLGILLDRLAEARA
jgi:tetraacyldisaccharide 4'-kinase